MLPSGCQVNRVQMFGAPSQWPTEPANRQTLMEAKYLHANSLIFFFPPLPHNLQIQGSPKVRLGIGANSIAQSQATQQFI